LERPSLAHAVPHEGTARRWHSPPWEARGRSPAVLRAANAGTRGARAVGMTPSRLTRGVCIASLLVLEGCVGAGAVGAPQPADAGIHSPDAGAPVDAGSDADAGPTADAGQDAGELFSIVQQPPVNPNVIYANPRSLWTQRIVNAGDGGPFNHLMPGGDTVIATLLSLDAHGNVPAPPANNFINGSMASYGDRDQNGKPFYFSTSSDPLYRVEGATECGPEFEPLAHRTNGVIDNLVFHGPSGAFASGALAGNNSTDQSLAVWDESGDPGDVSNGRALHFYAYGNGLALPTCPGGGHAGTLADPCPFTAPGTYCGWNDPLQGRDYDNGAGSTSIAGSPYAAMNRFFEISSGHIRHAALAGTACEGTSGGAMPEIVFPNSGSRLASGYWGDSGACKCGTAACTQEMDPANGPPNGSLYYADYTGAQLACMDPGQPQTTCVGLDGAPVAKLDPGHFALIEQLTYYGWYQSDTGGIPQGGLFFMHHEGGAAYKYYHDRGDRNPDPLLDTCPFCFQSFVDFMDVHCPGPYTDPTAWCYPQGASGPPDTNGQAWEFRIFYNLPNGLPGPGDGAQGCSHADAVAGECGVGRHLHIAHPCVAVAMAGLSEDPTQTWTACPNN
jgi:hypothetical protein